MLEVRNGPSQGDIFVPQGREQEYCRRSGIEYRNLANGVVLFGVPRQVSDRRHASVNFAIPSGAIADPAGKQGLHHFMEHIVASELGFGAHSDGVLFNAATSPFSFVLMTNDGALDSGRRRGIWSMLPKVRGLFTNPFYLIDDVQSAIEREKGVVLGEMAERELHAGIESIKYQALFAPDNTIFTNTIGTPESVNSFGINDVYGAARSIFQPDGLVIGALTESDDPSHTTEVVDKLEELFGTYQETNTRAERIDFSGMDRLNPHLQPGALLRASVLGRAPKLTQVSLVWQAPLEKYSVGEVAFEELSSLLTTRLWTVMRRNGWGYSATTERMPLHKKQLFMVNVSIPTSVASESQILSSILPQLQNEVIGQLGSADVDEHVERRQEELATVPMPAKAAYGVLMDGLTKDGRVIDLEELQRRMREGADTDQIMKWQNMLHTQKPAIISVSV